MDRWLGGAPGRRGMVEDALRAYYGGTSKAGTEVTVETALKVATVLACCRRIAGGIARLPLKLYQAKPDGTKRVASEHPLHYLLARRPNARMTSYEWRETSMFHALLAKGAYTFVNRVGGEVRELVPLVPSSVMLAYDKLGNITGYRVRLSGGGERLLRPDEVMRVPGPSWDGREGLEMITMAREAIGLAIATEDSLASLHRRGVRPSGILTTDGTLQPNTVKRVEDKIAEEHTGSGQSFGVIVLDAGLKYQAMAMTAADAQSMQAREFQVAEIARMFEISPMMIGHPDKSATYASAEAFMQDFVNNTLGPWIERWEQAIERDLLSAKEVEQGYFVKLDVRGLLRGDAKTRAEFYKSGILTGWMTRNEAREKEDLDPIDGLNAPLVPLNMGDPTAPGDPAAGA